MKKIERERERERVSYKFSNSYVAYFVKTFIVTLSK